MRVYLASPYTKGDVAQNVYRAIKVADELAERGYTPHIPHLTHFWHIISPKPLEFWYAYDIEYLKLCDCVLRLDGQSVGADHEVETAKAGGIPVYYDIEKLPRIKS